MGSQLLTLTKGTWLKENNQTPHTSDTLLRTNWYTNQETAVAQFVIPQALRYKRFINAVLIFYTTTASGIDHGAGARISAYRTGDTLDELIWANMGSLGERGEIIDAEPFNMGDSSAFPRWRYIDITGIFAGNVVNNTYFTVMINAFPGLASYAGIGNVNNTGYETKLSLTYEDVPQLPPSPSYPVGTYVTENTDLLFAWNWESSTPATQSAVQLEYKLKTASTWTTVSLTQTTHTYLLSGGLSQGVYQWRIKGTNDAGEVSDYSAIAEFSVVGKPAAPVIANVPNKALTEITWTAADQNAFDIQIIDSGNNVIINDSVASAVASYKPNVFLKGSYTAKVRIRNSTGLISDWATKSFTINAAGPTAPTIQLFQDDTHILIETTAAANTSYAVIRTEGEDGPEEILGTMSAGKFTDSTFGFDRQYKYLIRAWISEPDETEVSYTTEANAYYDTNGNKQTYEGFLAADISVTGLDIIELYGYQGLLNGSFFTDSNDVAIPDKNGNIYHVPSTVGYRTLRLEVPAGATKFKTAFTVTGDKTYTIKGFVYSANLGYTDSDPEWVCYPKTAIVLESENDELIIDKSEDTFLPYAEDVNGETAVYNCIGRELPVVEHGVFSSIAFKSRFYVREDQKQRLVNMAKKDRIYYRDYSGRSFPVAIQPPISFDRWMSAGYMADVNFIQIADAEVVVNV